MAWSTTPIIGSVALSGTKALALHTIDNIVGYSIPGKDIFDTVDSPGPQGVSFTERIGRQVDRITANGFFCSGSDDLKAKLISMTTGPQRFIVPSTVSGGYFYNGAIQETSIQFKYDAARSEPFYEWILRGAASGYTFTVISGSVTYVQPNVVIIQAYTDYAQPNVIASQSYVGTVLISGVSGY